MFSYTSGDLRGSLDGSTPDLSTIDAMVLLFDGVWSWWLQLLQQLNEVKFITGGFVRSLALPGGSLSDPPKLVPSEEAQAPAQAPGTQTAAWTMDPDNS